jgi:hypothetical protein
MPLEEIERWLGPYLSYEPGQQVSVITKEIEENLNRR